MTNTTDAPAMRLDRDGFPVVPCDRCCGVGTIAGFYHVLKGVCFKCNGDGILWATPTVTKLALQYRAEERRATTCSLGSWIEFAADGTHAYHDGVAVGDVVRPGKGDAWRTVTAVRRTRRVLGWGTAGDRLVTMTLMTLIKFDDGETVEGWGIQWQRRNEHERLRALRDELAGKARDAYARTLARRAKR